MLALPFVLCIWVAFIRDIFKETKTKSKLRTTSCKPLRFYLI